MYPSVSHQYRAALTGHGDAPALCTLRDVRVRVLTNVLRAFYGSKFTQRNGVTDPLSHFGPSLRPPQVPDVRLPEIVNFHRVDEAAWAVIGLLTKTDAAP